MGILNKDKKLLHVFDFDGTITKRDTLFPLAFFFLKNGFLLGFLEFFFIFIGFKLNLLSNLELKKSFISCFFKNRSVVNINLILHNYFTKNMLYNNSIYDYFLQSLRNKESVIIVSANFDIVIKIWLKSIDVSNITVIATCVGVENDMFTGKIVGNICRGKEKEEKLKKHININEYYITSYADEASDKYIMSLANKQIWVKNISYVKKN